MSRSSNSGPHAPALTATATASHVPIARLQASLIARRPALSHLGPFLLERPVARGGMGQVWRATHDRTGAVVAIKVLTSERARDPRARALFRAEVRAVARLHHPHVVQVVDRGETPDGLQVPGLVPGSPWLAMEWASLGAITRHDLADWAACEAMLVAVLSGLAHAHANGVIHRDLKLDNLLRCAPTDARPGLKIADFGIARALDDPTDTEARSGTADFMAPEQFRGTWRHHGPWTDLYALGCVTWTVVCGLAPFEGPDPMGVALAHLHRDLPDLRPRFAVPSALDGWLRWLAQKDPRDRPPTAAHALAALRGLGPAVEAAAPVAHTAVGSAPTLDDWDLDLPASQTLPSPFEPAPLSLPAAPPVRPRTPAPALAGAGATLFALRQLDVVGRHVARTALWTALAEAVERRAPQVVVLAGPPGAGKTRLARWIAGVAHEQLGARHLASSAGDAAEVAQDLVAAWARTADLDAAAVADEVAWRMPLPTGDPGPARQARQDLQQSTLAHIARGAGDLPDAHRDRVLADLFEQLARERPLVLVLDDAHAGTARLARTVVDRVQAPVLVVLAVQPSAAPTALDDLPAQRLTLDPMPDGDLARLLREGLFLEPGTAGRVESRAQGSPGFAIGLVRHWIATGALVGGPAGFALAPDAGDRLPDDLAATWSARLADLRDALGPATALLERAAFVGRRVDPEAWAQVTPDAHAAARTAVVEALLRRGLARRDGAGWRFASVGLRELVRAQARDEGRAPAHHRACLALAFGPDADDRHRLATHLLGAGRASDAADAWLEAIAAPNGVRRRAHWVELAAAALDATGEPDLSPRRGRVEQWRCHLLRLEGRPLEAGARAEALVALADRHRWPEVQAVARIELLYCVRFTHRRGEGAAILEELEALPLPPAQRATVLGLRGEHARLTGDLDTAERAHTENRRLSLARGERVYAADGLRVLARIAHQRGDLARALALAERSVAEHAANQTRTMYRVMALNTLAEMVRAAGDGPRAKQLWLRALGVSEAIGGSAAPTRANLAMHCLERGDLEEAAVLAADLRVRLAADRPELRAAALLVLLTVAVETGQDADALWTDARAVLATLPPHPDLQGLLALAARRMRAAGAADWAARLSRDAPFRPVP